MKTFFLILIPSLLFLFVNSNKENTVEVLLKNQSEIYIEGTSNVNTFDCHYSGNLGGEVLEVEYISGKDKLKFENTKIALASDAFDCGGRRINRDFRELLMSDQYPEIEIELLSVKMKQNHFEITSQIKLAGIANTYDFKIKNVENNRYVGDLFVNICDFDLVAPKKMMGMIVVDEEIDIHFDLALDIKS
ncbi:MAG: hypothetical protein ABR595_07640 [Psychroflexus sp.]